jgi:uridine kinase
MKPANYNEIFNLIETHQEKISHSSILIGIDGNSAGGKSSLAQLLSKLYDCNVFHMDHFFLPKQQKTPERLREAGGNVDYERFYNEVMTSLTKGIAFKYQVFDCHLNKLSYSIEVIPKKINIIEGVYSLHPAYQHFFDLKIFLSLSTEEQSKRILKRNGKEMLLRFQKEWIPLENYYFNKLGIQEVCDCVIDTSNLTLPELLN